MSLTAALLSGTALPTLIGTKHRHLMDNQPITSQTYCREQNTKSRLENIETVFAAVVAGERTIAEIESHTGISSVTISKALAALTADDRVRRLRVGKKTIFEVLK